MGTGIISEGTGFINLAHRDVLDSRGRKQVQRNQFVVGVGRSDGESVEGRRTVAVAQSADDNLSGRSDGYSGDFLDSLFHVGDAFGAHLLCTEVFDGYAGALSFYHQAFFVFKILFCHDGDFIQLLVVGLHGDNQFLISLYGDVLCLIGYVLDNEGTFLAFLDAFYLKMPVDVGNGTDGGSGYLHGGSDKRLLGRMVDDRTFQRIGLGADACGDQGGRQNRFAVIYHACFVLRCKSTAAVLRENCVLLIFLIQGYDKKVAAGGDRKRASENCLSDREKRKKYR